MSIKPATAELRESIDRVASSLQRHPRDIASIEACGHELTDLGTQISAAIEAEFLLVEPTAA